MGAGRRLCREVSRSAKLTSAPPPRQRQRVAQLSSSRPALNVKESGRRWREVHGNQLDSPLRQRSHTHPLTPTHLCTSAAAHICLLLNQALWQALLPSSRQRKAPVAWSLRITPGWSANLTLGLLPACPSLALCSYWSFASCAPS
jgi:hypothetical protein